MACCARNDNEGEHAGSPLPTRNNDSRVVARDRVRNDKLLVTNTGELNYDTSFVVIARPFMTESWRRSNLVSF